MTVKMRAVGLAAVASMAVVFVHSDNGGRRRP